MSHERGFRNLKCIRVGLWARWAPKTSATHLQDAPKPRFVAHMFAIWFDLSLIRGTYFQNMTEFSVLLGVLLGGAFSVLLVGWGGVAIGMLRGNPVLSAI